MHILVTGAAGFIGFHLCRALLAKGHSVVGLDNINSYYTTDLKFGRLAELGITRECVQENVMVQSSAYGSFRFVKCSLEDNTSLEAVFASEKFDKVCNLAAQAGVRYSFENPSAYIQSNIVGFANIIGLSHKYGVKHFVYASSSSVYGNSNKVPFEETDRVDTPESIYAATKKSNEPPDNRTPLLYSIRSLGKARYGTIPFLEEHSGGENHKSLQQRQSEQGFQLHR